MTKIPHLLTTFFGFHRLKIGNKLAVTMIGLSLVMIALISALFYFQFNKALTDRVLMQLSSVARLKKIQIVGLIEQEIENVKELVSNNNDLSTPESDETYFFISEDNPFQYDQIPDFVASLEVPADTGAVWIHDLTTSFDGTLILAFTARANSGAQVIFVSYFPEIQQILLERTGLGLTGESYLVGTDYMMRSESRFLPETKPTNIKVETQGVNIALERGEGQKLIKDYRDVEVFSAFQKIEISNLTWVLLSEIDYEEALLPLASLKRNLSIILIVILIIVFLAAYAISRQMVRPLIAVENALIDMSLGKVEESKIDYLGSDEIEQMITALHQLAENLKGTIKFAHEIGSGNFDAGYLPQSEEDMLGTALLKMQQELKDYQQKEEDLIQQNRRSLIEGQERERSRLSRELHDGIGPMLTNLRFRIQASAEDKKTQQDMLQVIDSTITEVRHMSYNLMPSVLEDFGAGEAIENLVEQMKNSSGKDIKYKHSGINKESLPDTVHVALYRISQEALNNALKHANANQIRISVTQFEDHVSLFISDDGVGFDPTQLASGHGLRNMEERVKLVGGQIVLNSEPESGTSVEVEIPIQ